MQSKPSAWLSLSRVRALRAGPIRSTDSLERDGDPGHARGPLLGLVHLEIVGPGLGLLHPSPHRHLLVVSCLCYVTVVPWLSEPDRSRRGSNAVDLPPLTEPQDTGDVHEGERYDDQDWSGADREFWTFTGCAFRRVSLDGTRLRGSHLNVVTMAGLDVPELVAPRSTLAASRADGRPDRLGRALRRGWRSVSVSGSKIGYLNARAAEWQDVRFADCTIGELDLSAARVARLVLDDCRIETLTLSGARLTDVDLRRADFRAVTGLAGLAGSWITEGQLTELAPYLANHLKISIGTRTPVRILDALVDAELYYPRQCSLCHNR